MPADNAHFHTGGTPLPQIGPSLQGLPGAPPANLAPLPGPPPLPAPQPQATPGPQLVEMVTGLDMSDWVKLVVFGGGGCGKTVFAATAPEPFFIDTQRGARVLRDWPELLAKANIAKARSWEALLATIEEIKKGTHPTVKDRTTFILDTIDSAQRANIQYILQGLQGSARFLPMEHHYKQSAEMIRQQVLIPLRDLEKHIIILTEFTPDATPERPNPPTNIRAGVTPKVASILREEFDMVGYMELNQDTANHPDIFNVLITRAVSTNRMPKSRFRHLPSHLGNPTFPAILDAANTYKEQPK
jgi:hypothetical protein